MGSPHAADSVPSAPTPHGRDSRAPRIDSSPATGVSLLFFFFPFFPVTHIKKFSTDTHTVLSRGERLGVREASRARRARSGSRRGGVHGCGPTPTGSDGREGKPGKAKQNKTKRRAKNETEREERKRPRGPRRGRKVSSPRWALFFPPKNSDATSRLSPRTPRDPFAPMKCAAL